jgi:bla regulator protein BlaR1
MEILLNAIIKAAGWSIIHSLWQGAILYSILLLLFILSPKLSAKSRHNLAFMTLCGISVWFMITFYNEFSVRLFIANNPAVIGHYSFSATAVTGNIIQMPASFLYRTEQSIPLIVLIYSTGLILQILYLAFGYLRLRQIKTTGISDLNTELQARFIALATKIGIKRNTSFKLSSIVSVPMVLGYLKPVVLLPLSIVTQMNQNQLEAIIIHELSHIRRNDYILNLLKISVETILFFNPFVWLSGSLIDTERENACDDLVLKITGSPLSYAQTLLELEKIKSGQQVFTLAATGKKYHLLNRIKRITSMKTNNSNLKQQLFGIFLIAATALSISWINVNKNKNPTRITPKTELQALKRPKTELLLKAHNRAVINSKFQITDDTTKKKFKIIVTDENGKVKEYNNMKELPEDLRDDFMKQSMLPPMPQMLPVPPMPPMPKMPLMVDSGYLAAVTKMYNTPEFRKKMENIDMSQITDGQLKYFNENIAKQFSSPEWKAKMQDFQKQFDSQEWKTKMQDFQKQLDSPEWKKYNADLQKMFDSPEWKTKMQDFQKQFESKEWKDYFEKMKDTFSDSKSDKKAE